MKPLPAVILAAGRGRRLGRLSDNQPKPMTEVNGVSIFDNLLGSLIAQGLERIILVTGYLDQILVNAANPYRDRCEIITVYNEIYATTNNIYSLWLASQYLTEGFYLFEADIFFENAVMESLVNADHDDVMLIGKYNAHMDGTVVDLDARDRVLSMYLKQHQGDGFDYSDKYKTVNFYRIGKEFAAGFFLEKMKEHIVQGDLNSYYELIIKEALDRGHPIYGLKTGPHRWWEIDTLDDLTYCESLFG
ncbi:MAG TPA: phosphocholine cytidylyltransferase family protein [bacterium]|nr:phosphocholine cytidylyltransferase family protein [bacterium]